MLKPIILSAVLATLLATSVSSARVVTAGGFDWSSLATEQTVQINSGDETEDSGVIQKKKGNSFARALTAPFRAFSRLFGGRKKNDQVARRINDQEAAKFQTSKLTRVKDATPSLPTSTKDQAPMAGSPSSFDSHLQRGRELLLGGDVNSAISELSIAANINSKSGEVFKLLGIAYESKGLRDRALKAFETALKTDEQNAEHLNNLGFLLFKNGDFERSTKYLKRAAKVSPQDARIWNNLALAQFQRNKFEDAYASFVKAVGEYDAHLNMASQLQKHAYAKDAIKHLEQAQALRPNSLEALIKLVSLYEMTGRLTDAENTRRELLALKSFADAKKD